MKPWSKIENSSSSKYSDKVSEIDDVWAHCRSGHLYPIPYTFVFPKNQTLLK